jgi:hypothetical protein
MQAFLLGMPSGLGRGKRGPPQRVNGDPLESRLQQLFLSCRPGINNPLVIGPLLLLDACKQTPGDSTGDGPKTPCFF